MRKTISLFAAATLAFSCVVRAATLQSWNDTNIFKSALFNPASSLTNIFTASDSGTLAVGSGSVWTWDTNYVGGEDSDHVFVPGFLGAMTRTISRGTNLWALTGGTLAPSVAQTTLRATNIQSHDNLTAMGGFTFNLGTNIVMPPGSNTVPVANAISRYSYVWLTSDANTTDPTLRTAYLGVPTVRGGFLLVENYTNGVIAQSAFQMTNQAPLVGAMLPWQTLTLINGDWKPTRGGESLLLQTDGRGWREVARFWGADGTVQTNLPAVINPTQFYVPYKADTNRFGDSWWYYTSTGMGIDTNLYFGPGLTNYLGRDSGFQLGYHTSDASYRAQLVFNNSNTGNSVAVGMDGDGSGVANAPNGFTVSITGENFLFDSGGLSPNSTPTGLGRHITPWSSLYLNATNFLYGFKDVGPFANTNYIYMAQSMSNRLAIFDVVNKTNDVNGPITGYSFRTNGVELFSITGTGGPSSAANWVASGATDSTLAGTASANTVILAAAQTAGDTNGLYQSGGTTLIRTFRPTGQDGYDLFIGGAGNNTLSGSYNTAIGSGVQATATSASYNTGLGHLSQANLTTGTGNSAYGFESQYYLQNGNRNDAFGYKAQYQLQSGSFNTALGFEAQGKNPRSTYITGTNNIAVGYLAQESIETALRNVAMGVLAQAALTNGQDNVAIGDGAQFALLSGNVNNALGSGAQAALTTSSGNDAFGAFAQYKLQTGTYNDAFGYLSQYNVVSGHRNTSFGAQSLKTTTGSDNVALGNCAGYYETGSNKLFIDNATRANEADARLKALIYGNFAATPEAQSLTINGVGHLKYGVQDGYTNVLVSTTAKDFFYVSVPNTNGIGGHVVYTVFGTDGTDVQEISGDVKFAAVAKGTTVTATLADVQGPAALTGGSTLTAVLAANTATNNVFALGVTATTSLTTTNLVIKWRVETPSTFTVNAIP